MILSDYKNFLDRILSKIHELKINISDLEFDHIGYTASSDENYDKIKDEFLKIANLDHEFKVGGRRVSAYKLKTPLIYKDYKIQAIELVAPKGKEIVKSGLEHVEFILDESFDTFLRKYPDLDWDTSNIDRKEYSMLKLKLDNDMQIKFPRESVLRK